MDPESFDEQVVGIAALEHPISRRVYQLVAAGGWVSRDAAADTLGLARSVAAFHLDKLVGAGLLAARFERTSGRTGPGAGRPAKLYGRSDRQIEMSIPPRRYELAGRLLADAVERAAVSPMPVEQAVSVVAREAGERIGAENAGGNPAENTAPAAGRRRRRGAGEPADLLTVLTRYGYEPRTEGAEITLLNCPFHSLAQQHRDLVCGMNVDLLTGVVCGLRSDTQFQPRLAPEPGYCCVRIVAR